MITLKSLTAACYDIFFRQPTAVSLKERLVIGLLKHKKQEQHKYTQLNVGRAWSVDLNLRPGLYLLFGSDYPGLKLVPWTWPLSGGDFYLRKYGNYIKAISFH